MTQNSSLQVFKESWKELENTLFTSNETLSFSTTGLPSFAIKPDGTEIYAIFDDETVETHPLSVPWDVDTFQATTKTFVITEDTTPTALRFKDDGTKMFVVGLISKTIYEYALPIPFDISSIVDAPVSLSLSFVTGSDVVDCAFSRDGDFLYISDKISVYGLPLPIPWDVTSNVSNVSFDPSISFDLLTFKREGDKMYLGAISTGTITEYDLATVNDVTTAVPNGNTFSIGQAIDRIDFKPTGLEFFVLSATRITKFHLETTWNISTASHFLNILPIASTSPRGVVWKPDGLKMYVAEDDANLIREFSVSAPWNVGLAVAGPSFDLSTIEDRVTNLWWKPDGTRLYIIGLENFKVIQLNASTPYDVSTLSDSGIFFDIPFGSNPNGFFIRDDGNKMYFCSPDDNIREFDMVDWDITTLVLAANQSFSSIASNITDIFFKFDGKEFFFVDQIFDQIRRVTLEIPWDISSTIFDFTSFTLSPLFTSPQAMFVRYDAERIFIAGGGLQLVVAFDLLLEFNNSLITNLGDELVTDLGELLVHT